MAIQKLGSFFSATPELSRLYAGALHLRKLQAAMDSTLPSPLSTAFTISSLSQGTLTVHAENGAVALKLKQMAPRLLEIIQKSDAEVRNLHIIVQIKDRHQTRKRNKPTLTIKGRTILSQFAENLQETPLKSAITHLVQEHADLKIK